MEENKFAPPYIPQVSEEVVKQLGFRSGKVAMTGLPSPDFDAYHEAAQRLMDQAAAEEAAKKAAEEAAAEEPKSTVVPLNRKQRRQAAKKAIKDRKKQQEKEPETHYVCDPSKNMHCKKTHCYLNGGPCHHTKNLECAKQPVEKARIVIPVSGKERTELMKQYAKELKDV